MPSKDFEFTLASLQCLLNLSYIVLLYVLPIYFIINKICYFIYKHNLININLARISSNIFNFINKLYWA